MFRFEMDKTPLAQDGKTFDVENDQAVCFQLHIEGDTRDEGNTEAGRNPLLDGAVVPYLHTYL